MATQIAFHPKLKNPFLLFDLAGTGLENFASANGGVVQQAFEEGKISIFDNCPLENLEFYFHAPSRKLDAWVPPLSSGKIRAPYSKKHCLNEYCDEKGVLEFQKNLPAFEKSVLQFSHRVFPNYQWKSEDFSYRFNEMGLGYLHLDVPDELYSEHQFRLFINMDWKPRILAIGPTFEELADMFWKEMAISEITHLPLNEFIGEFRRRILDETPFKFRELPRHIVTLDPGSMWLSHSSLISHGLVWGRKTVCLEGHIQPESLNNPDRNFATVVKRVIQKHMRQEGHYEASPNL